MEKNAPNVQKFLDTLVTENRLLEKYRDRVEELNIFMQEKSWDKMEQLLSRLDLLSREIRTMDERRDGHYKALRKEFRVREGDEFYSLVVRLPEEYRDKVGAAYRNMKSLLIQVEGLVWAMDLYVRALGESMNQILNEFFPHRKGKIYARNGQMNPAGSVSLLFNREL